MKPSDIDPDWTQPGVLWAYYERSVAALVAASAAIRAGTAVVAPDSPFFGLTPTEADELFRETRSELDRSVTLLLTASFEAGLKTDLIFRLSNRKDPFHTKLSTLFPPPATKLRLLDLLDFWKAEVGRPHRVGAFRRLLKHRHWMAHGRYWVLKAGPWIDPVEAWRIGKSLFDVLPGFPRLPAT